jgi:hypothetical protein
MDAQNTTENWMTVFEAPWHVGLVLSFLFLVVVLGLWSWPLQPAPVLVPVQLRGNLAFERDELKI